LLLLFSQEVFELFQCVLLVQFFFLFHDFACGPCLVPGRSAKAPKAKGHACGQGSPRCAQKAAGAACKDVESEKHGALRERPLVEGR
jgi:hypothetical protein